MSMNRRQLLASFAAGVVAPLVPQSAAAAESAITFEEIRRGVWVATYHYRWTWDMIATMPAGLMRHFATMELPKPDSQEWLEQLQKGVMSRNEAKRLLNS